MSDLDNYAVAGRGRSRSALAITILESNRADTLGAGERNGDEEVVSDASDLAIAFLEEHSPGADYG